MVSTTDTKGAGAANQPLHLTAAASWFLRVQLLAGRRGR